MLDLSSLGQLTQLKKDIHDATPRLIGRVKGTSKRFGFVVSDDDGKEYLLPQTEMEKVLPGDHIHVVLEKSEQKNADDKPIAKIEKLIASDFSTFIGTVKIKNNQYYVLPDHAQINRWIFIPPKFRKNLNDGDMVSAQVCQHPFTNKGRVQAQILEMIGQPNDPFIEHRYAIVKQGIVDKIWQQDELNAIRQTAEQQLEELILQKTDQRETCFVTIDGISTQDMDDALNIVKNDDGWLLQVAIADVSSFIQPGSPLDKIAAKQVSSIYLLGQKIAMLPDVLSSNICSLRPNEDRLVLVCKMQIDQSGAIISTDYEEAVISSKAKLAYSQVAAFLEGDESLITDESIQQQIKTLAEYTAQRRLWREEHALIMDDYADFRYQLDDKGKITQIEHLARNQAQRIVEECMLSCNQATAAYLGKNAPSGLYISHSGYKKDQLPGIKKLLDSLGSDIDTDTLSDLDAYKNLQKQIPNLSDELPVKDILRKKLNRSEWVNSHQPHFGLGIEAYTTFTSPIRKYSDLICHRMIKACIANLDPVEVDDAALNYLNQQNQAVRDAQRDCEMSLKCQYLQQFKGQRFSGEISMINHRMIGVYLKDFDIHGQIEVRNIKPKLKFKQDSLQLLSDESSFQLNQVLDITIDNIDVRQRQIRFKFAVDEPVKEEKTAGE